MAQYNFLNVADTYGRGRQDRQREDYNALRMQGAEQGLEFAANREDRQAQQFTEQQRLQNTQRLYGAIQSVKADPQALPQVLPELEQVGILAPGSSGRILQSAQENPQQFAQTLQQLESSIAGALGQTVGQQQRKIIKGADGRQYYADSGELVLPNVKPKGPEVPVTSDQANYRAYAGLSPEERRLWNEAQRGPDKPATFIEKQITEASDEAVKARSNVGRYEDIAQRMQSMQPPAGVPAQWREQYKQITGQEDAVTELRKEWNNLRVSAAVQNLPPGVASDKDIELVMSAFLPENANPEAVASFMRGLAKLEGLKADYEEFKADYLSQTGSAVGLSKAWRERVQEMAAAQPAQGGQGNTAPDGTVIRDAQGRTFIKQNGQWVQQ